MTSIDEVRGFFRRTPIAVKTELDDRFLLEYQRVEFYLLKSEIDEYLKTRSQIITDPETAIFFPGYYEHLIELQGPTGLSRMSLREDAPTHLSNQDASLTLEISAASSTYLLKAFEENDFRVIRRRVFMPSLNRERVQAERSPLHLSELFRTPLTIKIRATKTSRYFGDTNRLRQICEAALFHFSYGTGAGLSLSRSWERTYYRLSQRKDESVQFPRRTYDSDLVSYYQLALSSDSLMLGYIALYKILEHFFLSASEKVLHKHMVEKLVVPEFSHTKTTQLRELVALIRKHDQRMDEQRMLATVIEENFRPDEIAAWVAQYERSSGEYYTVAQTVFEESHTLDLNPDRIASSLAKRIYHVRNVLVHNKEGELPRFVPFSGQEAVLSKEIPIVLFLAEQLILKTGKDI